MWLKSALGIFMFFISDCISSDTNVKSSRWTWTSVATQKCKELNVFDVGVIYEYAKAFEELTTCLENSTSKRKPHTLTDFDEACRYHTESGYAKCIENAATKTKQCVSPDEQYIPEMVFSALNYTTSKLCAPENRKALEVIAARVKSYGESPVDAHWELLKCTTSNQLYFNNLQAINFTLKQDYLCSDVRSLYDCTLKGIAEKSKNDYSDLLYVNLGGYLEWCKNHNASSKRSKASEFKIEPVFPMMIIIIFERFKISHC